MRISEPGAEAAEEYSSVKKSRVVGPRKFKPRIGVEEGFIPSCSNNESLKNRTPRFTYAIQCCRAGRAGSASNGMCVPLRIASVKSGLQGIMSHTWIMRLAGRVDCNFCSVPTEVQKRILLKDFKLCR